MTLAAAPQCVVAALFICMASAATHPCDLPLPGSSSGQLQPPSDPTNPDTVHAWLSTLQAWRIACAAQLHYNGSVYRDIPQVASPHLLVSSSPRLSPHLLVSPAALDAELLHPTPESSLG